MKINDKLTKDLQNIVESGDGYIKYSDGTMICYGKTTFEKTSVVAYGALYRSVSIQYDNFAKPFISTPITSYSFTELSPNNFSAMIAIYITATTTNPGKVCIVKENNDQISGTISYIAIGRWK